MTGGAPGSSVGARALGLVRFVLDRAGAGRSNVRSRRLRRVAEVQSSRLIGGISVENPFIQFRLKRLAFTEGFADDQLDRLAELARPVHWDAEETVFREGDQDTVLSVVEEGRVAIEVTVPGRGRVTMLTIGPGEMSGWSSLFYQPPKTAAARAVEPTTALAFDALKLRALCEADPRLGYAFTSRTLQVVSERLKATRLQLLDLFGR